MSVFDRSGLASLSDLQSSECKSLFNALANLQLSISDNPQLTDSRFSHHNVLKQWSRCWEYPYVYHQLNKCLDIYDKGREPVILDFGCGATFFPFAVASMGATVIGSDVDLTYRNEFALAEKIIKTRKGRVNYLLSNPNTIALEDCTVDIIYCISVFEHIPIQMIEVIIDELHRVLKPGGRLILTFDLSENDEYRLSKGDYLVIRHLQNNKFHFEERETITHPADLLHTLNSPYPLRSFLGYRKYLFSGKQILKKLIGKKSMPILKLFVYGAVLRKEISGV